MATFTTNYNLEKPDLNNTADIQVINDNMDIIDQKLKETQDNQLYKTVNGTATAITITLPSLVNGYSFSFVASANNGGAATTINSRPLYKPNTTIPPTLISGKAYTVWYNLSNNCFFIKASSEGTATTAQVLAGVPFSNENDTGLVGTMPERGTVNQSLPINGTYTIQEGHYNAGQITQSIPTKASATYTPSASAQTIASGQYLSGNQTISAVTVDASKVLSGTTIAGTAGTMPNRAGDTAALASSVSGTTLMLRASAGYRDGTDDNVTITDANWVEGNIPNGITMFGKTGINTNKKWATGTVATTYENDIQGTGVQPYNIFTVSGLAFTPSHVIIIPKTNNFSWSVFITNSFRAQLYLALSQPMSSKAARMDIDGYSSYARLQINGTSFSLVTYIQNSGLIGTTVYRNCNGGSFDWYAYE